MKRFKTSLFGYKKKEVKNYLDGLLKEIQEKTDQKDEEILQLNGKLKDLSLHYQEIKKKEDGILEEKEKISQAFIKANQASSEIIESAKKSAKQEVEELEAYAERERERIVDLKKELKYLRESARNILVRYEDSIVKLTADRQDAEDTGKGTEGEV
ncbi:MAG: DivIVA domain-containing protein [Clostridia bacterium]